MGKIQEITPDTFLKRTGRNKFRRATYETFKLLSLSIDPNRNRCYYEFLDTNGKNKSSSILFVFRNETDKDNSSPYCTAFFDYPEFLDADIKQKTELEWTRTFSSKKELNDWFDYFVLSNIKKRAFNPNFSIMRNSFVKNTTPIIARTKNYLGGL